jgi:predicted secreted protein
MIVFLIAATALAGDPPVASAPLPAKPKKEAKICRTQEMTGTRMGGRTVCKTADEWRLEKDDAERMISGRRDLVDGHQVSLGGQPPQ